MRTTTVTILLLLLIPLTGRAALNTEWKVLSPGLEYATIKISPGVIHAIRIDPALYKMGVVTAKDIGRKQAAVKDMARKKGAIVAINGGFFTPEYESLGLLVSDGKVINPLKQTSWWSIFYLKEKKPYIVHTNNFAMDPSISMAVQSGPRLVISGFIPKLKPSIAERSAVCIAPGKGIILVATENLFLRPDEFAAHLRKGGSSGGLGCHTALNLDGGSSTQMYARVGSFELNLPGINKVTNAVVVYSK